jgi:hypothetical protein
MTVDPHADSASQERSAVMHAFSISTGRSVCVLLPARGRLSRLMVSTIHPMKSAPNPGAAYMKTRGLGRMNELYG